MKCLALRACRAMARNAHDGTWASHGPCMDPTFGVDPYLDLERRVGQGDLVGIGESTRAWSQLFGELEATIYGRWSIAWFEIWLIERPDRPRPSS